MTKAIIFDFDGTIANTKAFAYQVYQNLTNQYHIKQLSEEEFDHLKTLSLVDKLRAHDLSMFKLPRIARRARRAIHTVMNQVEPFDGMISLIKTLHQKAIKLFIVSSNSEKNIKIFTNQYEIDLFEEIYGRAKYLKKEKVLKKLLDTYQLKNDEVIYVGDEVRDIHSCQRIHMNIASVTWGFDDLDMLKIENPNVLCETPESLEKYILKHISVDNNT